MLTGRTVAENFIWAMESFGQAMGYVQGRKVVILFQFVARVPFEELGEGAGSRVEAVNLIFDGLVLIVDTSRVEFDLTGPEFRRQSVSIQSELSAKAGTYKCRLVLRNLDTGRAVVAAALITVPEPDRK